MKNIQYNYRPADSSAETPQTKKVKQPVTANTTPIPDEATVARLNAIAREYPYCAWGKPKNNTLL